jgi:hypothetical protein
MEDLAAGGATLACGLFAGAALYITLVEHPARLRSGTPAAVAEFRETYPRAAAMQAPLAVAGGVLALVAWLAGESIAWLVAGLLLVWVAPFTVIVIAPTTHRLQDTTLPHDSLEAASLLRRWGSLHLARTATSLAAFVLMLVLLAR